MMYTRYPPQSGRDRSTECAHAKSKHRAKSPIGVNIGGMPYGLGLGWMPYRRLWGICPSGDPDPNRFWVRVPPCISPHLPRPVKSTWILHAVGVCAWREVWPSALLYLVSCPSFGRTTRGKGRVSGYGSPMVWKSQTRKDNRRMRVSLG